MNSMVKEQMKIKIPIPQSFKNIFNEYWDIEGYPSVRVNYVGILGYSAIEGQKEKVYTDKKLFADDSHKPLLFHFYEYCMRDSEEHEFLKKALLIEESSKYRVKLSKGKFDMLIPTLFLNEVTKIVKYGLLKAYELKEDNLVFAKGKINFKCQMANDIRHRPKIACRYWDLTTDIFFNQALLCACTQLASRITVSKELKFQFAKYATFFRQQQVSLEYINPSEFSIKRQIPKRYFFAMQLAEAIIKRYYHSTELQDAQFECPSFMLDAAKIWESFLRVCIKKVFNQQKNVKVKRTLTILCPSPRIEPDIVIELNDRIMILDPKYKSGPRRIGDLYQMAAYLVCESLNLNGKKNLCAYLLYYDWEKERDKQVIRYYPKGNSSSESYEIRIEYLCEDIDECHISKDDKFDFEKFIEKLKERVK